MSHNQIDEFHIAEEVSHCLIIELPQFRVIFHNLFDLTVQYKENIWNYTFR